MSTRFVIDSAAGGASMIRKILTGGLMFAALALGQVQSQGPVRLDTGRVSGALVGSTGNVSVYKGIPFAAPPVGELRWKAPQPAKDWGGVLEATKFSAIPPQ